MTTTKSATVPTPLPPHLSDEGGRDHLRDTSSLLRVLEERAVYLTLRAFPYLKEEEEDGDGDGENSRRRGGWTRMRKRRRCCHIPIVLPRKPPVPGSDGRVPSPSEALSAEVRIRAPPHQ